MKRLIAACKKEKLKLTPQRMAIYEVLKSTKAHPSAESIYDSIKEKYPTMSLATVYKTLKTLVAIGLIQEINVGEGNFRYDANALPHPHIMCLSCGRVDDIEGAELDSINDYIRDYTNYDVVSSKVYFYGTCPDCK